MSRCKNRRLLFSSASRAVTRLLLYTMPGPESGGHAHGLDEVKAADPSFDEQEGAQQLSLQEVPPRVPLSLMDEEAADRSGARLSSRRSRKKEAKELGDAIERMLGL